MQLLSYMPSLCRSSWIWVCVHNIIIFRLEIKEFYELIWKWKKSGQIMRKYNLKAINNQKGKEIEVLENVANIFFFNEIYLIG